MGTRLDACLKAGSGVNPRVSEEDSLIRVVTCDDLYIFVEGAIQEGETGECRDICAIYDGTETTRAEARGPHQSNIG